MPQESGDEKSDEHGWKVQLDHEFTEKRNQYLRPRLKQLPDLIGMSFRYFLWYLKMRRLKRKPFIDGMKCLPVQQMYGVPLGGIGAGTIGRGFKGEFCRFQLIPGVYKHRTVKADQFIVCIRRNGTTVYQKVLSPLKPKKELKSWVWGFDGSQASYRGLYPRAWYTYDIPEEKIRLVCRQVSPVIPNEYKDSSLPVAVFTWTVYNLGDESAEVSIAFAFKNGTGGARDKDGGCWTEAFGESQNTLVAKGVLMHQIIRDMNCTVAISAAEDENVKVSHLVEFNPKGNGADVWDDLMEDGHLNSSKDKSERTRKGEEIASAVAAQCCVDGLGNGVMRFCLVWDMPTIWFKGNAVKHRRRYTNWFDKIQNASSLSVYALANVSKWENLIEEWQNPILNNSSLPNWYKSALFNELYYISDGGSVWLKSNAQSISQKESLRGDVRPEFGQFAYLEGHEYRMYNTYDVHFYASFALAMLWPKLQLSLQYDIMDATLSEDRRNTKFLMNGHTGLRKSINSVPHDIGDPEEEPWLSLNSYFVHDTTEWKDLNTKFVLQVYRDYTFTKDEDYLRNMWPTVKILMAKCMSFDVDGDGLIENSGSADQTYDTWIMKGSSAYCGGLWLAALCVTTLMARKLGDEAIATNYHEVLEKAKQAYNKKLWNDTYYKFDDRNNSSSFCIMSDQLCGHWYLKASGVTEEVFPLENVKKTLKTIYDNNVMKFKGGKMGAVNGMLPSGIVDLVSVQSEEVWVGVTYALAATMLHEGMFEEGMNTAKGMYTTIYDQLGLGFQTPEAIYAEKNCRSLGYMRPLSIWAVQWALQNTSPQP
uniref:Non-lysosomal glucosylceramidase n=1 Tax=Strigamia maritima TaxID=126957 RepID=T1JDY2_STRMM